MTDQELSEYIKHGKSEEARKILVDSGTSNNTAQRRIAIFQVFCAERLTRGTTEEREAIKRPYFGQEYFDTDEDLWVKWNGSEWRTLTGVAI